MVLDSNLLYGRRMTLITFSDGKVVMKGDAVGTEQACCCCACFNLFPGVFNVLWPRDEDTWLLGFDGAIWEDCGPAAVDYLTAIFQEAGWTLSVTTEDVDDPGQKWVKITVSLECEHCMDWVCDATLGNIVVYNCDSGQEDYETWTEINNQDIDNWYEIHDYSGVPCSIPLGNGSEIDVYGTLSDVVDVIYFTGCCGKFDLCPTDLDEMTAPRKINGIGEEGSQWIPRCNPLP